MYHQYQKISLDCIEQGQRMTEGKKEKKKKREMNIHNNQVSSWFAMFINDHVAAALVFL